MDTWYRQLDRALQAQGLIGLTEDIRLAVVNPADAAGTGAPAARSARRGPAHSYHIRGRHGGRSGQPAGPRGVYR